MEAVEREDFGYVRADTSDLTTACAAFFARAYGWEVPASRIFLVADVLRGIAGALDVFAAPGSAVVVPTPAYPPFFEIIELGGRRVVQVPLVDDDDGRPAFDLDAIDAAFRNGARSLLLCNPHNPTGRVFTTEELRALSRVVGEHGARVVSDEVHAPLVFAGNRHVPYATVSDEAAEHSLTITSASKAWNIAGLKCAQVVATNHGDAKRWRNLPVFQVAGPTPLGIAASTAAYAEGGPWLDCSALRFDDPARFFVDHAHVALSDGPPFGAGNEHHVRLNFATSRALLEQIVHALGSARRARS